MNTTSPSRRAYAYEKPSLADMQSHLQAAQNEQNAHTCVLHEAWAKVPASLSRAEQQTHVAHIAELLQQRQAVMVAHYYVEPETWPWQLAAWSAIPWKWPNLAKHMRRKRCWWLG